MKIKSAQFFRVVSRYPHQNLESEGVKDMIRYDRAFVNPRFPGVVAFLKLQSPGGTYPFSPTDARWDSFGFDLTPISTREDNEFYGLDSGLGVDWKTYRRIKDEVVPVTLEKVLAARDMPDLDKSL